MGGESERAGEAGFPIAPTPGSHAVSRRDAAPGTPGLTLEETGGCPGHAGYRLGSTDLLRWLTSRLAAAFRTEMGLGMPQAPSPVGDKGTLEARE